MKLDVFMFGALAEAARAKDSFDLKGEPTANDLVRAVGDRYPHVRELLGKSCVAVNRTVVEGDHRLEEHDEIALLPPMSGGASISVRLEEEPSVSRVLSLVSARGVGGTAVFVGTVRATGEAGEVDRLEYTAYDAMAKSVIAEVAQEAASRWSLIAVAVEHGVGTRRVGEPTFVVACAAAHREEAFDACRYVVDEVKNRAPIWKKEFGPWGERWVGL